MHDQVHREPEARPVWRKRLTPRNVGLGLLGLWLLAGFYVVPPDEQAVETLFGRVADARVLPGFHYNPAWPAGRVYKLKTRQLQRAVVGGEIVDNVVGRLDPLQAQFLTGDQNIIQMRTVVQFSVATPEKFLFRSLDPAAIVRNAVESELGRQVAGRVVDDILTTEKVAIQEAVLARAQALVDRYELGVAISTVNIESVSAPPETADAFRDVASARADFSRIISEAEGYANDILPRARGEAQQSLEAAGAYRETNINEAQGDAARFRSLEAEYRRNPQVTRRRLHLEAMEEVLPRLEKMVVDDQGNLDLTIVRRKQSEQP